MTQLAIPDTTEIQTEAQAITARAEAFAIETAAGYAEGGEFLKQLRRVRLQIKDTFDKPINDAYKAHRSMIAARDKHDKPLADAESIVNRRMGAWKTAEDARREAAERAAREAERKAEEERRLAEAVELEEENRPAEAERVLAAPVEVAPIVMRSAVPQVQGISTRKTWKWEIIDPDLIPREYFILDEKAIGAIVRTRKDQTRIPGIRAYSEDGVTVKV